VGHKDLKNGICCFSYYNAQHLRVAQRIKKLSVDYTSAKVKSIQSWRYKTLAVIKRHQNHLSFYHTPHMHSLVTTKQMLQFCYALYAHCGFPV